MRAQMNIGSLIPITYVNIEDVEHRFFQHDNCPRISPFAWQVSATGAHGGDNEQTFSKAPPTDHHFEWGNRDPEKICVVSKSTGAH